MGANYAQNKGNGTTYDPAQFNAGNTLYIKAGNGADLLGVQGIAKHIATDIKGDFNLVTLQNEYKSKNAGISGSIGTNGGSIGISGGNTNRHFSDNVSQLIGTESVRTNVTGNTNLVGSTIAQGTYDTNNIFHDGGNLTLNTGTLTYSDLKDKDSSFQGGIGFSTGYNKDTGITSGGMISGNIDYSNVEGTTKATLGNGLLIINDAQKQEKVMPVTQLANLNRDVNTAQIITKNDEQRGEISIPLSVLTPEGREKIKQGAYAIKAAGEQAIVDLKALVGTSELQPLKEAIQRGDSPDKIAVLLDKLPADERAILLAAAQKNDISVGQVIDGYTVTAADIKYRDGLFAEMKNKYGYDLTHMPVEQKIAHLAQLREKAVQNNGTLTPEQIRERNAYYLALTPETAYVAFRNQKASDSAGALVSEAEIRDSLKGWKFMVPEARRTASQKVVDLLRPVLGDNRYADVELKKMPPYINASFDGSTIYINEDGQFFNNAQRILFNTTPHERWHAVEDSLVYNPTFAAQHPEFKNQRYLLYYTSPDGMYVTFDPRQPHSQLLYLQNISEQSAKNFGATVEKNAILFLRSPKK